MPKLKKSIVSIMSAFVLLSALMPMAGALAAAIPNGEFGLNYAQNIGLQNTDPKNVIVNVVKVALSFLGVIAVIIILIGGFMWMTAGGNDDKVAQGRKWIINGAIGLLIILASYGIANFLISTINNNIITQ